MYDIYRRGWKHVSMASMKFNTKGQLTLSRVRSRGRHGKAPRFYDALENQEPLRLHYTLSLQASPLPFELSFISNL